MHRVMDGEDKGIKIYLREIGQIDLITPEQEVQLARRIKKGDAEARHIMIRANLRLVVKIAQDYSRYGLPLLDLISEGNIGLMKAVERFDPKKGGKLSTYAAWWIKQAIRRALANQSKTIRLPSHLVDKIARSRKMQAAMTEELKREPTNEELAARLGVEPSVIAQWQVISMKPTSLDAPIGDENGGDFNEIIGDENAKTPYDEINDKQLRADMEVWIEKLDRREREILKYRYGLKGVQAETLEDVGARFKITRERVRQIQNLAVEKLRDMMDQQDQPSTKEP
ncbi:MAG: RNA polymerase sigma factor RpoD/SigA [Lentisphaerota bacterium]